MPPEFPDLVLYGTPLLPFVFAFVMLLQQLGLSDFYADYVRAGLLAGFTLLVINQTTLAELVPWFPAVATQALLVIGVFLSAKGLWPDMRSLWQRIFNGYVPTKAAAQGNRRGRFW